MSSAQHHLVAILLQSCSMSLAESCGHALCPCAGPYAGLDRFVARDKLWNDMEAAGLVIKKEAYTTR